MHEERTNFWLVNNKKKNNFVHTLHIQIVYEAYTSIVHSLRDATVYTHATDVLSVFTARTLISY